MMIRWRLAITALLVLLFGAAGGVSAQPPGGGPFGGFGSGTEMLLRPDVRKELELLDDQVRQLEQLGNQSRERVRDMFAETRDVPREERMERVRSLMEDFRKETQERVSKILLPHQMKRLEQLSLQFRLRGGAIRALGGDGVANELGMSDEQKEQLQAKARELEEQLRKKIAQLRADAQEELLEVLTPPQRKKWRELVGEPFEFERIEPGDVRTGVRGDGARGSRPNPTGPRE